MRILAASTVWLALAVSASGQDAYEDFGGFYAGVIGGFSLGSVSGYYQGTTTPPPAVVAYNFALNPAGLALGALAGYEYPWQQFVLRVEGDLALILGASASQVYPLDTSRSDMVSIHGTGHIRGIAGYPVGQFTPFIAVGIAGAATTTSHTGPVGGGTQTWSQSALLIGPSVGAGGDLDLGNGMKVRLEVLADFFASRHYDWLGDNSRYSDVALSIFTARAGVTVPF